MEPLTISAQADLKIRDLETLRILSILMIFLLLLPWYFFRTWTLRMWTEIRISNLLDISSKLVEPQEPIDTAVPVIHSRDAYNPIVCVLVRLSEERHRPPSPYRSPEPCQGRRCVWVPLYVCLSVGERTGPRAILYGIDLLARWRCSPGSSSLGTPLYTLVGTFGRFLVSQAYSATSEHWESSLSRYGSAVIRDWIRPRNDQSEGGRKGSGASRLDDRNHAVGNDHVPVFCTQWLWWLLEFAILVGTERSLVLFRFVIILLQSKEVICFATICFHRYFGEAQI